MSTTMTLAQKAKRRDAIVAMFRRGHAPRDIQKRFGMHISYIHAVLRRHGERVAVDEPLGSQVDPLWEMPEDDRRREIIRRAARGAREALANG